jgi:hypothetical protein
MAFKRRGILGVVFVVVAFSTPAAWSWGDIGHETTAEIAERQLTPKAKAFVRSILGVEPLAVSATFPDKVRSDHRFDGFAPYHFIEIPPGLTYLKIPEAARADRDSNVIITEAPVVLKSSTYTREQKMLMLKYLIHVVGDVHQPLHVGNGVDMGANLCDVNWPDAKGGVEKINLHSVWDDKIISLIGMTFQSAEVAKGLKKPWYGYVELTKIVLDNQQKFADDGKNPVDYATITASTPTDWYEQSHALHSAVYPDAVTDPKSRVYCKAVDPQTHKVINGAYDASKIPTLTADYIAKSILLTELQLLRGGYRLASMLNAIAETQTVDTSQTDEGILASVMFTSQQIGRQPQSLHKKKKKKSRKSFEPSDR